MTGIGLGLLLLAVGITFWKLHKCQRLTPYILLVGGSVFVGSTFGTILQNVLGSSSDTVASLSGNIGVPVGTTTVLTIASVVLGIVLWHGLHPKKGTFAKQHNILVLVTAVVWGATGGIFGAFIHGLATAANHAGTVLNYLHG